MLHCSMQPNANALRQLMSKTLHGSETTSTVNSGTIEVGASYADCTRACNVRCVQSMLKQQSTRTDVLARSYPCML